jgi:hypothetical protein
MGAALDVAIGLFFLYLLLALIVTTLQELLATFARWRAQDLYSAIEEMLGDKGSTLAQALYSHPLIANLAEGPVKTGRVLTAKLGPSYIPSKTFALALLDVLQGEGPTRVVGADKLLASADEVVAKLPAGALRHTLELLLSDVKDAGDKVDKRAALASDRIEGWFNDRMARAGGWYKRRMQWVSLALAAGVAFAFRADTLVVVTALWKDSTLRGRIVATAQAFQATHAASSTPAGSAGELTKQVLDQGQSLLATGLPLGWNGFPYKELGLHYPLTLLGCSVTALAVSLGAGFWFDLLSKALKLRGSGPKVSAVSGEVDDKDT